MHVCQLSNENAGCPKGLDHEVWQQRGVIVNQANNSLLADEKNPICIVQTWFPKGSIIHGP